MEFENYASLSTTPSTVCLPADTLIKTHGFIEWTSLLRKAFCNCDYCWWIVLTSTWEWDTQPKNINWDTPCTEILVQWLLSHPANCRILFSNKNSGDLPPSLSSTSTERPVGHNKKEVQAMITQAVFEDDCIYKDMLKASYRKCRVRFKQSGEGIIPGHPKFANLHDVVLNSFPWYDDLHSIWQGNPSFDPEPFNSEPNKNHAEGFLAVIQNKTLGMKNVSGAGAEIAGDCMGAGGTAGELEEAEEDMPSQAGGEVTNVGEEDGGAGFDEAMLGFGDEQTGGDESPDVNMDSASVQGDKLQWPSTPSDTHFPSRFSLLRRGRTPSSDSQIAFSRSSLYLRPPPSSASIASTTTSESSSSSSRKPSQSLWDSSSKTSLMKPSSTLTKCGKSQLQDQVIDLSHEAESLVASSSSGKTKHYMVKMEYLRRKEELMKEQAEMATKMELELEAKKLDIQLMKAQEITFNSEAETLRLKIELAKLMKADSDATPPAA
ncbi:hypothetical protein M404DRAFT_18293 [Pisolithus tinctorius Marx 270]|uniref:Uncharacterized protein n=1 Tax=Pisolithus tinctorius Marx 270 TaxID=870435 RepID=A0A0C3PIS9_PISTI|nr:hypothetical protein M404DRAFT_18293 [Pisolithus tinctorius Marx 270]